MDLRKQCSWTTIVKRDAESYGVVVFYQTGEIELRLFSYSVAYLPFLGDDTLLGALISLRFIIYAAQRFCFTLKYELHGLI